MLTLPDNTPLRQLPPAIFDIAFAVIASSQHTLHHGFRRSLSHTVLYFRRHFPVSMPLSLRRWRPAFLSRFRASLFADFLSFRYHAKLFAFAAMLMPPDVITLSIPLRHAFAISVLFRALLRQEVATTRRLSPTTPPTITPAPRRAMICFLLIIMLFFFCHATI